MCGFYKVMKTTGTYATTFTVIRSNKSQRIVKPDFMSRLCELKLIYFSDTTYIHDSIPKCKIDI